MISDVDFAIKGMKSFPFCPVCGESARSKATRGISYIKADTGRLYLQHTADNLDLSIEELLEEIKVYQCNNCKSYWCDPWLSARSSSQIFTQDSPDHMASWGNFEQWISKPKYNTSPIANKILYKILEDKIGAISRYAEYGCPFNGFFFLFKGLEINQSQRINIFSRAMGRTIDPRWTFSMRIYRRLSILAQKITIGYHKLRLIKEGGNSILSSLDLKNIPNKRVLLTKGSVKQWGNNCVRYGGSCSYYSSSVLDVDTISFDENLSLIEKGEQDKHDLLGIFNILDHANEPLKVIMESLRLANNLIIVTHHADTAGKQHLYAFHESFAEYLSKVIDSSFSVNDISKLVHDVNNNTYRYIFICKEK
jgi:hypothetical protein